MFLEDQVWPKKCGHMAGKVVVPKEDWLAKLEAAVAHRTSLHITARTDARAAVSLDDAIERARMALELGVDAVFIEAPESLAELEQIAAALPDCVRVANMIETGKTPLLTPAELHDMGFDLIVAPLGGLYAAIKALTGAYATLAAKGTLRDDLDGMLSFDEFNALVDLDEHYRTRRTLPIGTGSGVTSRNNIKSDPGDRVRQPGADTQGATHSGGDVASSEATKSSRSTSDVRPPMDRGGET